AVLKSAVAHLYISHNSIEGKSQCFYSFAPTLFFKFTTQLKKCFMEEYINNVLNVLKEFIGGFAPAILKGAITLILGVIILKIILRLIFRILDRSGKMEEALKSFLKSLIKIVLYFVLIAIVGTVL